MSDTEAPAEIVEVTKEDSPQLTQEDAIKQVLKNALIRDGLQRGLRQAAKALDRRTGLLCFLSNDCSEDRYKRLIRALCKLHSTPVITVDTSKQLGEWAGLCRFDAEGHPRKVVGCACVVVTDWGKDSDARTFLQEYIKSNPSN